MIDWLIAAGGVVALYSLYRRCRGHRDGKRHSEIQRCSKRCLGCGKKLLRVTPPPGKRRIHDNSRMAHGVGSVTYSGGKISCGRCNVNHNDYCVHGTKLSHECEYCPEDERLRHVGDWERHR